MKTSSAIRCGAIVLVAAGLLLSTGCAARVVSATAVPGTTTAGTTGSGTTTSGTADPDCTGGNLPQVPDAQSRPLLTIDTQSSWGPSWGSSPGTAVYDDGTYATFGVEPRPLSRSGSPSAIPPVQVPLRSYTGGAVDECRLEGLLQEARELAAVDFGQTGILDGDLTSVSIFDPQAPGRELIEIDVENLNHSGGSSTLSAAQLAARGQLRTWISQLEQALESPVSLPRDRVVLFDESYHSPGRPPAPTAVPWTAASPDLATGHCVVLTGRDAAEAVRAAALSSVRNGLQDEEPDFVYSGTFAVDGEPTVFHLMVAAPAFGCR